MRKVIICVTVVFACLLCVAAYIEAKNLTPYPVQNTSKNRSKLYSQFHGYSLNSTSLLAYSQQKRVTANNHQNGLNSVNRDSIKDCTRNGVKCSDKCICTKCGKAFCTVDDPKCYPDCKGLARAVDGKCPYCGEPVSDCCGDKSCVNSKSNIPCDTICNHDKTGHKHRHEHHHE